MESRLKWAAAFCLTFNFVFAAWAGSSSADHRLKFKKQKITLSFQKQKKSVSVEMALTPAQQEQGLMFRKTLGADSGMLFVFSDERPREFWMKNTLVDLDIGYFNKEKVLIDVQTMKAMTSVMQKEIPTYPSQGPAQYALEMPAGWFQKNAFPLGTSLLVQGP